MRGHFTPVTVAADIEAVIAAAPGGWTARGRLVSPGDDEGFRLPDHRSEPGGRGKGGTTAWLAEWGRCCAGRVPAKGSKN